MCFKSRKLLPKSSKLNELQVDHVCRVVRVRHDEQQRLDQSEEQHQQGLQLPLGEQRTVSDGITIAAFRLDIVLDLLAVFLSC